MMSSTRFHRPSLEIYQDPVSSDHARIPPVHDASLKTSSPLRPIKNASSRRNVIFNPPSSNGNFTSPLKTAHHSSSSPMRAPFSNKLSMVPIPPQGGLGQQTDSLKKAPMMSKFNTAPRKALFATSNIAYTGKENYHPAIAPAPAPARYDCLSQNNITCDNSYAQKSYNKRVLLEAAPIEAPRPAKKAKLEPEAISTTIEQFPVLSDDGSKPAHSYAMLIGMAILRAPNRRLTLAQIYKWISDTYSYYNAADAGWQNSIRHNLSLNKAFVKQERPKDDPGKGNYWAIEVGKEALFTKDKPVRKGAINETASMLSTAVTSATSQEVHHHTYKILTPAPQEFPPASSFMSHQPVAPAGVELSSDATIPLSDAIAPEEEQEDEDFISRHTVYPPIPSSPPPMMHSSPPVPRHVQIRENTPPPVPRFPTSSRTRSHKRNFASMDDSGYYSSLNSSALRGPQGERRLTSEADRPRIKRGRAEEEIARLRGSSYDSPTKGRTFVSQSGAFAVASSSPIRRGLNHDSSQMLPPLTPAVKLKPPTRPPPSVSPNTNLRLHRDRVRQLVGSPDRGLTALDENLPWSPAFHLDPHIETGSFADGSEFDVFADTNSGLLMVPGTGSPEKRPMKRSRLDQMRSPRVLGDISNNNSIKDITSTPMLKFSPTLVPSAFESPSKYFDLTTPIKFNSPSLNIAGFDMPQDFPTEDWYGAEFLADEVTEFSGMDMLQGFKKIGAGSHNSTPKNNDSRPVLGRCFTSLF